MAKKPTYEELELRVKELEQAKSEHKHAEDELQKRETTIQTVFDVTPVGICIMENRVYKYANRYWCEHFGYSEEDLIGRTTEFLYESHEEYECVGKELYKNLLKKGIAFSRTRLKQSHGEFRDVNLIAKPLNPYDLEAGAVVVVHDITERKRAEERLRESEKKYRILFEQMTQGVFRQRADGLLIDVNPAVLRMFGMTKDEFLGKTSETPALDVIYEDGSPFPGLEHPSMVALRTRKPVSGVVAGVLNEKTQKRVWVEINAIPEFRQGENNPYQVMVTMHDLTDYKQSQVELQESEDKFRSFTEQSLVGMYLISDDVFKYINPKFAEIFGYSVDEILNNMYFPQLVHPEDLATVKKQVDRRLSGETKVIRYSFRGIKKSGETIHVEIFGSSMVLKGKTVAIGTMLDISARIDAEKALKESETRLKKAQSVAKIGNWEYDISAGKIWGSEQAFRVYGIERTSPYLPLDRIEACIPDAPRVDQALVDLIQENKSFDIELEVRQEVGGQTIFIHAIAELVYENGMPIKVLGVIQDVTEQKKTEKERENLEYQLHRAQKMEALGLLAGGVAHDLNNILSGIVTYPELLLMDLSEDSPLTRPIKTIQESGMRAVDVVADLLTIARGVATGKEALNLNTIVAEYLGSPECQELERTHSFVNYKTELDSDLLNMSGSPTHIKKALMNLTTNASEAIGGSGTVTISTNNRYLDKPLKGYEDIRQGEYAVLKVSDEGSGISPEDLARIFEPFYTKKVMGRSGTGLGLAVVWNTVQDHKGYINVKSREKGTVFELYFPVTREKVAAEEEEVSLEDYLGHGEKILVVDDEERQREIAGVLLTKLGYVAEAVSSGEEAIEYLKEHPVDLIVLDMVMPKGINGRETYEEIIKIRSAQKAIIASGYAKTKEVDIAQELGAGKYIKKPYTLAKIGLAVKEELDK